MQISEIVSRGRVPEGKTFRVLTSDGNIFDLNYDKFTDEWEINPDY